jgi:hypothetical protein
VQGAASSAAAAAAAAAGAKARPWADARTLSCSARVCGFASALAAKRLRRTGPGACGAEVSCARARRTVLRPYGNRRSRSRRIASFLRYFLRSTRTPTGRTLCVMSNASAVAPGSAVATSHVRGGSQFRTNSAPPDGPDRGRTAHGGSGLCRSQGRHPHAAITDRLIINKLPQVKCLCLRTDSTTQVDVEPSKRSRTRRRATNSGHASVGRAKALRGETGRHQHSPVEPRTFTCHQAAHVAM